MQLTNTSLYTSFIAFVSSFTIIIDFITFISTLKIFRFRIFFYKLDNSFERKSGMEKSLRVFLNGLLRLILKPFFIVLLLVSSVSRQLCQILIFLSRYTFRLYPKEFCF